MSLNGMEWRLLHRVMDLVDQRRASATEGVDAQRVKTLVLDVYRDQGIEVDEAVVEQAIHAAANRSEMVPGKDVAVPRSEMVALERAEARWKAAQNRQEMQRLEARLRRDPLARIQARIEEMSEPLLAHRPSSDDDLSRDMAGALVSAATSFRRVRRMAMTFGAGAIVASAALVWQINALPDGGGSGLWFAAWAIAAASFASGAWMAMDIRSEAGARTLALMRGQKALALKDYDNENLKKAVRLAGHVVRGSLKPLAANQQACEKRARSIAGEDKLVLQAWRDWDFKGVVVRENDLLVLQELVRVRGQHPFHAMRKLRELARQRG